MDRTEQDRARLRRAWYQSKGTTRKKAIAQVKAGKIDLKEFYRLKEANIGSW